MGEIVSVTARYAARRRAPAIPGLLSEQGFAIAVNSGLDLRRGVHTPVDLFAVSWLMPTPAGLAAAAAAVLSPLGIIGRLADGRIGMASFAPYGAAHRNIDALSRHMCERLEPQVGERGWCRYAGAMRLASAHAWTDTVEHLNALVEILPTSASRLAVAGG